MGSVLAKKTIPNIDESIPYQIEPSAAEIKLNNMEQEQPIIICNPGTFQELHKKCKDVMPTCFDGVRILFNNNINQHFQTAHLININPYQPHRIQGAGKFEQAGYKFSTSYVGSNNPTTFKPVTEMFPVLYGDIDTTGNMNANIIHHPYAWLRVRYAGQFSKSTQSTNGQLTSDFIGKCFTASFTVLNLNAEKEPEILVGQYLHSITQNVALGIELCYNNTVPKVVLCGNRTMLSAGIKVQQGTMLWTGAVGPNGLQLCAHKQASETLQFGIDMNVNFLTRDAFAQLGYQIELPKQIGVFRGSIDTNANISAVLEKRLLPMPLTFTLSALLNHSKQSVRLGCGVIIK